MSEFDPHAAWLSYMAKLGIMEAHGYAPRCEDCPALNDEYMEDYGQVTCSMRTDGKNTIADLTVSGIAKGYDLDDDDNYVNPEWCPRRRPADWPCNPGVCEGCE